MTKEKACRLSFCRDRSNENKLFCSTCDKEDQLKLFKHLKICTAVSNDNRLVLANDDTVRIMKMCLEINFKLA